MIRSNSWLKEDIHKLKELANAGSSIITLKKELGRTENAIRKQASIFRIELQRTRWKGKLAGKPMPSKEPEPAPIVFKPPSRKWSKKELDDLNMMLDQHIPLEEMSLYLERSKTSVKLMCHKS